MSARSILALAPLLCVMPLTALAAPQAPEAIRVAAIVDVQAPHAALTPANTLLPDTQGTRELTDEVSSPDQAAAPATVTSPWSQTRSSQETGPIQTAVDGFRAASQTPGNTLTQSHLALAEGSHTITITTLTLVLGIIILVLLL